jgi:hypothetical protein
LIEREERQLGRMKVRKEAKAVAKKNKPESSEPSEQVLNPLKPAGGPVAVKKPATAALKTPNRAVSIEPPRLTIIERKKMRHNFNMALNTLAQEEEKTSAVKAEEL